MNKLPQLPQLPQLQPQEYFTLYNNSEKDNLL